MFNKPLSDRIANYSIDCEFHPAEKLIKGKMKLSWKNTSKDFISKIHIHLYMNAFIDENSTFLRQFGTIPEVLKQNWGYCKIS